VALLAIGVLTLGTLALFWFTGLTGLGPVTRSYGRVTWLAHWLGRSQRPAETPLEFAKAMATLVPEQRQALLRIASTYARARFARQAASPAEMAALDDAWRRVRRDLARALVRQSLFTRRPKRRDGEGR
jgi:hypothetical protein